ncbi:MAG: GAF domain-containing protein, partial [Chloroflexota bacterium]|nr:GAF domain-containing protein [Chloroflexota bacterium]
MEKERKRHRRYLALQEISRALASYPFQEACQALVRVVAQALGTSSSSLMILDATKKKLAHGASHGLKQWYLKKGLLDPEKSLAEVVEGKPVAIVDASQDPRVQFPELAARAGITSIQWEPLEIGGEVVGSLRVYTKEKRLFPPEEVEFLSMAGGMVALGLSRVRVEGADAPAPSALTRSVAFAHPSEAEFAHLLDFYQMDWVYEPRSFPLEWEDDQVKEMLTPDFYLPGLDLYVEITTLKQDQITEKNR